MIVRFQNIFWSKLDIIHDQIFLVYSALVIGLSEMTWASDVRPPMALFFFHSQCSHYKFLWFRVAQSPKNLPQECQLRVLRIRHRKISDNNIIGKLKLKIWVISVSISIYYMRFYGRTNTFVVTFCRRTEFRTWAHGVVG